MKFDVIYTDPSWDFKTYSKKGTGRSPKYPCMTIDDIYNLPMGGLANKDCACFCWVTIPFLKMGIEALSRWGFEYKTIPFVWIKRNKIAQDTNFWGMGHWSRGNAELVLLGTKGHPKRVNKGVHQVVETFDNFETEVITHPVGEHSAKPVEVRRRIEMLMGDNVSKIVTYARKPIDGWTALGNEIDGEDLRDSIPKIISLKQELWKPETQDILS